MAEYNRLLIPESIDLNELTDRGGFREIPGFHPDKLAYLLFLIGYVASLSPTNVMTGGYTSLNAERVKRVLGNQYHQYIDRLVQEGIIEVDRQFKVGEKNRGYRFASLYRKDLLKVYQTSSLISKHLRKLFDTDKPELVGYEHLTKWFNGKLQLNEPDLVLTFCKLRQNIRIQNKQEEQSNRLFALFEGGVTSYSDLMKYMEGEVEYERKLQYGTHQLQMGWYPLSVDDTSHRFHSNLSRLKKELRNALAYDGKQLVSLDIKNSQPFFSLLLFRAEFWIPSTTVTQGEPGVWTGLEVTSGYTHHYNINLFTHIAQYFHNSHTNTSTPIDTAIITLLEAVQVSDKQDVKLYGELVENGTLYEYIASEMKKAGMKVPKDRQELKAGVFQTLFTDNRFAGQTEAAPKRLFKFLFPNVVALFEAFKQRDSTMLPILLQSIESYVILKVITKRIAHEKPRLPIFTIHDSIITTVGNEDYVQKVMVEELRNAVGSTPSIEKEHYTIRNLQKAVDNLMTELNVGSADV